MDFNKYIDKILHFLAGYAIADMSAPVGDYWSVAIATGAGTAKELSDKFIKKTKFDWADLACTFAGGFFRMWLNIVYGGLM